MNKGFGIALVVVALVIITPLYKAHRRDVERSKTKPYSISYLGQSRSDLLDRMVLRGDCYLRWTVVT